MRLASFWRALLARVQQAAASLVALLSWRSTSGLPCVFIVVEGQNDVEFLCRVSTMLHADDSRLPDLREMERRREIVFVPCGGGDSHSWTWRLSGLGRAEFHLLDRDVSPITEVRQQWAIPSSLSERFAVFITSDTAQSRICG